MVELKDSGKREGFVTGAVRDIRVEKGRYDLISPIALRRLAIHYERGARKYADRNWEKGINMSRTMDSLLRHANQYREGDRSEDHLAAIAWNAFALIHYEEMIQRGLLPKELADIPSYLPEGIIDISKIKDNKAQENQGN